MVALIGIFGIGIVIGFVLFVLVPHVWSSLDVLNDNDNDEEEPS